MLGAGLLAEHFSPTTVVAACGIVGTLAVAGVALCWPRAAASTPIAPAVRQPVSVPS
jgi:hypothetical protein